jgi:hypothetical protein
VTLLCGTHILSLCRNDNTHTKTGIPFLWPSVTCIVCIIGQLVAEELPDPAGPHALDPPLKYVAYCYAGCLAGWGPAYTSNGFAFSLNFLQAKHPRVCLRNN